VVQVLEADRQGRGRLELEPARLLTQRLADPRPGEQRRVAAELPTGRRTNRRVTEHKRAIPLRRIQTMAVLAPHPVPPGMARPPVETQ